MATEQDLFEAVKDSLTESGELDKLQAEVRAKVMLLLSRKQPAEDAQREEAPPEVRLVNALVREYLEWNGYLYSSSVLCAEASLGQEHTARDELARQLGVADDEESAALPLLFCVIGAYRERVKRRVSKLKKSSHESTK